MIKAIIFDFGGVLLRTQNHSYRHRLDEQFELARGSVSELVFNSDLGRSAQSGMMTAQELWRNVLQRLSLPVSELVRIQQAFWKGDALDMALINYLRRLKSSYQIALISNAMDDLRGDLKNRFAIDHLFDVIVVSAEEGMMKPESEIYLRTLDRLGRRPDETIFVDDSLLNVQAARQIGMNAVHFAEGIDLKSEFSRYGIKTGEEQ